MLKKRATKTLITESTRELLSNGSIESITVKAIAANCGITPQTFYNHFHDKYEVVAGIYTDALSPFLMSNLDDWFKARNGLVLADLNFYTHALSFLGQNSLRKTLIMLDLGKYLLHLPRDMAEGSVESVTVRTGLISWVYGYCGLFDAMVNGQLEPLDGELDREYWASKEGMMLWAPRIVAETLLDEPTCIDAYWDAEKEAVVPIWDYKNFEG